MSSSPVTGAPEPLGEPSGTGRFGEFGGRFVPETLVPACEELEEAFRSAWADLAFRTELDDLLRDYAGRPSPLTECRHLSDEIGVRVLLKREDLNHTGSHKINNVLGQALLARRMGKRRLVAETGAGQHGVATATVAALLGMECLVYMGEVDMARQELNVFRMRLLGAEVTPARSGSRTLKDAVNEAMRDWVATVETTHYCLGSVMGPHPYPWMNSLFQDGIFARDTIQMSGNAYTDAYDSSKGPYSAASRSNNGHVRTNGNIALSGNATIGGNAIPGPNQQVTMAGNAAVTGSTTAATSPASYTPVTVPGGATSLGALSVSGNKTRTLTAGTYVASSISITGNAKLIINASGGPVNLYVTGNISVAGNGIANATNLPSNLMIYQSGNSGIAFSGNADFYGTIYAPESPLTVSGNGNMFGAFVTSTLQNSGNGGIHFDQALKSIPGGAGSIKLTSMWTLPS